MARSKSRRRSGRRMRGDWVYRGQEYDSEGGLLAAQVASYLGLDRNTAAYTLSPGTPVGVILYDSYQYMTRTTSRAGGNPPQFLGLEARAEGRQATALAVEGHYYLMPSNWTIGSNWAVSARIVICDQNLLTGALDLPANYQNAIGGTNPVSQWANGWGNLAERTDWIAFATGNETQRWKFALNWRGRRRLKQHECLALFIQSAPPAAGSTTLLCTPQFRSLISDPNS